MGEEAAAVDNGAAFDDGAEVVTAPVEQTTEAPAETTTEATAETPAAETAPKVTFDDAQQAVFNAAIGKKTAGMREAERKSEDLQRQLDEVKASIPQEQAPLIPEVPDQFDDDFEKKTLERDQSIAALAQYQAVQITQSQQLQAAAEKQQEAEVVKFNETVADYSKRATKLGIGEQELQAAAQTIAGQVNLDISVSGHILNEAQGPAITMYLAKNPQALAELSAMSPMAAAVFIETDIKAKAVAGNPSVDPPPAPVDSLGGSGVAIEDPALKGAVFE